MTKGIISTIASLMIVFTALAFVGCGNNSSSSSSEYTTKEVQDATVAQPSVDESNFPENYVELENDVYTVVSSAKTTQDDETTGCDFLKIVAESKGDITEEVSKNIKDEVVSAVTEQVDGVTCNDATFEISATNESMGYLTVTFTYDETNAQDSKIYNVPVGS
jgi:hypothetical protein